MKQVSLCIPCFQAADQLIDLVAGARRQTFPFAEIVVYDDGSRDNTEESRSHARHSLHSVESKLRRWLCAESTAGGCSVSAHPFP